MAVFTVVGAGMMGSALCVPLVDRGHEVRLVGTPLDDHVIDCLRAGKDHPRMCHPMPQALKSFAATELREALQGADFVALGVSSAGIDWVSETLLPVMPDAPLFMITKGLGWDGAKLEVLPDLLSARLPAARRAAIPTAAIAGPCIAGELARKKPTCVLLAGRQPNNLKRIAAAISTPYYHVWTSTDVIGCEVCAALKNAYAMGVAFGAGLHAGQGGQPGSIALHNYESAVMAQATLEMARVVEVLGGSRETVLGLAGVGDLDVTNNGGRTGRFGRWLGRGETLPSAIEKMQGATLECLDILAVMRAAYQKWEEEGRIRPGELPLLQHMTAVALDGEPVQMPFARFFGSSCGGG